MWVEITTNGIALHDEKPETSPDSVVFFQEYIPKGEGYLIYDGEKVILLDYSSAQDNVLFSDIVKEELSSV